MESIITNFLWFQNQVKIFHWQTFSYAEHKAFDGLYSSLVDGIDDFVETFQGKYGRITSSSAFSFKLQNYGDTSYQGSIDFFINYLINDLPTVLDSKKDSDLLNIRDSILGDVNQTKYLLSLK